jgi:hypothetical protein
MVRKLTITVSDEVYEGLYAHVGPRRIGKFLEGLARAHVVGREPDGNRSLAESYREIAADETTEPDAKLWIEAGLDECLPEDDFSDWPGHPAR